MFSDLVYRLRSVFRRKVVEQELDDELRFHLEQQTAKLVRSGVSANEAKRLARALLCKARSKLRSVAATNGERFFGT